MLVLLDENLEKVFGFQHKKFDELNDELNDLQQQTERTDTFNLESFLKNWTKFGRSTEFGTFPKIELYWFY